MNAQIDVRNVLPSVHVPTLVLHRTGDKCLHVEEGRYVASRIPGAQFIELPGADHLPFVGDQDAMLDHIEQFLAAYHHDRELDRSSRDCTFVGNARLPHPPAWAQYETHVHREVEWFGGRVFHPASGGPAASFDGPARAIRCACALQSHASRMRIGVGFGCTRANVRDAAPRNSAGQPLRSRPTSRAGRLLEKYWYRAPFVTWSPERRIDSILSMRFHCKRKSVNTGCIVSGRLAPLPASPRARFEHP